MGMARVAERVVALDIAPTAIERALASGIGLVGAEFRVANIMDYEVQTEGPWDLVVMNETIYYLGWLYFFYLFLNVGYQLEAEEVFHGTKNGVHLEVLSSLYSKDPRERLPG